MRPRSLESPRRHRDVDRQALLPDHPPHRRHDALDQLVDLHRHHAQLEPRRVRAREGQQIVDHAQQRPPALADALVRLALLLVQRPVDAGLEQIHEPADPVQWRPQLVRDVREEMALLLPRLDELLRAPLQRAPLVLQLPRERGREERGRAEHERREADRERDLHASEGFHRGGGRGMLHQHSEVREQHRGRVADEREAREQHRDATVREQREHADLDHVRYEERAERSAREVDAAREQRHVGRDVQPTELEREAVATQPDVREHVREELGAHEPVEQRLVR